MFGKLHSVIDVQSSERLVSTILGSGSRSTLAEDSALCRLFWASARGDFLKPLGLRFVGAQPSIAATSTEEQPTKVYE